MKAAFGQTSHIEDAGGAPFHETAGQTTGGPYRMDHRNRSHVRPPSSPAVPVTHHGRTTDNHSRKGTHPTPHFGRLTTSRPAPPEMGISVTVFAAIHL